MPSPTIYQPGTVEPGPRTSEFWLAVIMQLVAAAVAVGSLFDSNFNLDGLQALVPTISIVAAAIVQGIYTISRSKVKAAALNSLTATGSKDLATSAELVANMGSPSTPPNVVGIGVAN